MGNPRWNFLLDDLDEALQVGSRCVLTTAWVLLSSSGEAVPGRDDFFLEVCVLLTGSPFPCRKKQRAFLVSFTACMNKPANNPKRSSEDSSSLRVPDCNTRTSPLQPGVPGKKVGSRRVNGLQNTTPLRVSLSTVIGDLIAM